MGRDLQYRRSGNFCRGLIFDGTLSGDIKKLDSFKRHLIRDACFSSQSAEFSNPRLLPNEYSKRKIFDVV